MTTHLPQKHLPWQPNQLPLMLAPMQGVTNRALRQLFIDWVKPDVVFTEFVRVRPGSKKPIADNDCLEVIDQAETVPLVVQLIGRQDEALVAAAGKVQDLGAVHLNINLGCPYGRMTGNSAGGALLKDPEGLQQSLEKLRAICKGSFSVKLRSGYDSHDQVFGLLPLFEECGVDFLVLHPRLVTQRYTGRADHSVTAKVVEKTSLPVIANGDMFTADYAKEVLAETKAAGLMFGRGAIADPFLFERVRGTMPGSPHPNERATEVRKYLWELLERYKKLFHGDHQVLCKMKEILNQMHFEELAENVKRLKRANTMQKFESLLEKLE